MLGKNMLVKIQVKMAFTMKKENYMSFVFLAKSE